MSVAIQGLETRRAHPSDVEAIAAAHRDSIRSLGPAAYPSSVVHDWQEGLTAEMSLEAMENGEVFFIATGRIDGESMVLGFTSDYALDGTTHGVSAYVRGRAARRGIGSILLRMAEAHAVEHGATTIQIDASLAAVEFYRAHGFVEVDRGETRLTSGRPIACVFMRKALQADANPLREGMLK